MTNAELIKALRYCISDNADDCDLCPYQSDCKSNGTGQGKMIRDAAAALKAADKRIAELMPKEGKWIATSAEVDGSRFTGERCSRCGWWKSMGIYHYCPNCGARMQTVTDCHTLEEGER